MEHSFPGTFPEQQSFFFGAFLLSAQRVSSENAGVLVQFLACMEIASSTVVVRFGTPRLLL